MSLIWFYSIGGTEKRGPVSAQDLAALAKSGALRKTDLIWKEGLPDWVSADKAKGLFPADPATPPPLPTPPPSMAAAGPPPLARSVESSFKASSLTPASKDAVTDFLMIREREDSQEPPEEPPNANQVQRIREFTNALSNPNMEPCIGCGKLIHITANSCPGCGATQNAPPLSVKYAHLSPLEVVFSLNGRITRLQYWESGIFFGFFLFLFLLGVNTISDALPRLSLYNLLMIYPAAAVNFKRCHDLGRSRFFSLLLFIPLLNIWPMIEFGFIRGTVGSNRYGPDPLGGK